MKWTAWLRRRKWERGMDSEMRFHVEAQIRDHLKQGISLEEAERLAGLEFGPFALAQDECRDQLPLSWLDHLRRDIRTALHALGRSPSFAVAAILTLALGIGANTAIFSVVNTFLLR